jgi:hypothetical protein
MPFTTRSSDAAANFKEALSRILNKSNQKAAENKDTISISDRKTQDCNDEKTKSNGEGNCRLPSIHAVLTVFGAIEGKVEKFEDPHNISNQLSSKGSKSLENGFGPEKIIKGMYTAEYSSPDDPPLLPDNTIDSKMGTATASDRMEAGNGVKRSSMVMHPVIDSFPKIQSDGKEHFWIDDLMIIWLDD